MSRFGMCQGKARLAPLVWCWLFCLFFCFTAEAVTAQGGSSGSSSINPNPVFTKNAKATASLPADVITFSEFPVGTAITDQYANKGIIFGGDAPFVTTDGANPTSPVLSGTPMFQGAIEGIFVDPADKTTPTPVSGFTIDAGYFDNLGSVRLSWYDKDGKSLGQKVASVIGIQTFTVENSGPIYKWRIETIAEEPAGFAIDNVSIKPLGPTLIFRENNTGPGSFFGRFTNYIPGYDHVGFQFDNLVYESNVPYTAGTYVNASGTEHVVVTAKDGVQFQHSKGTFEFDALAGDISTVNSVDIVPIPDDLAPKMRDFIKTQDGMPFYYLPYPTGVASFIPSEWIKTLELLAPEYQKALKKGAGELGFTCVGLVERSAEESGHNGGQGFIPNQYEYVEMPTGGLKFAWPPVYQGPSKKLGLLSPELLLWALTLPEKLNSAKEWIQGFIDPADFLITDPLGRRFGYTAADGLIQEIPGAFYSGDGFHEQFLILNPVPGLYKVEIFGIGQAVNFAMGSSQYSIGTEGLSLPNQSTKTTYFIVEQKVNGAGDVNGDGSVNIDDVTALQSKIPTFTSDPNDPGDLNGDGILNQSDVDLLTSLVSVVNTPYPNPPLNESIAAVPINSFWFLLSTVGLLALISFSMLKRKN